MMNALFSVSLFELFVGGGGRLLEVGPVTVRMILFAICLCVSLTVAILRPHRDMGMPLALGLVAFYLLVHIGALFNGALRGNDLDAARTELQQSLYWLAAPFLAVALSSQAMVLRAATLVKVAGVVLALAYLGVIGALALGVIDYLSLLAYVVNSNEFMFRSESFFVYKGFLYLCISTIFFIAVGGRFSTVWLVLVIVALALTLTRGFVISTSFAAVLMLAAQRRWRPLTLALLAAAGVAFFIWGYLPSQNEALSANRDISNNQRIADFDYIVSHIKIGTLLIGQGLGAPINGRLNIENTFLWALWRLGILGMAFWLTPLALSLSYFARIGRRSRHFRLACAFMFSTVLVYTQTLSNPYLNNPIGLSFVIVALFSLRTLARLERQSPTRAPATPAPTRPQTAAAAPLQPYALEGGQPMPGGRP